KLRKLVNTDGQEFIETLPKYGYRFSADLRRTLVEVEEPVIFEKRTVRRVSVELENGLEDRTIALPPAARPGTGRLAAVLLIPLIGIGLWFWYSSSTQRKAVDPYAAARLTEDPNDDTGPQWTRDGRIRFSRVYPDHPETWIMNADGSAQTPIKMPDGKRIVSWSPDERQVLLNKLNDESKLYLANTDGSGETLLPFRVGSWSPDSQFLAGHEKVS